MGLFLISNLETVRAVFYILDISFGYWSRSLLKVVTLVTFQIWFV